MWDAAGAGGQCESGADTGGKASRRVSRRFVLDQCVWSGLCYRRGSVADEAWFSRSGCNRLRDTEYVRVPHQLRLQPVWRNQPDAQFQRRQTNNATPTTLFSRDQPRANSSRREWNRYRYRRRVLPRIRRGHLSCLKKSACANTHARKRNISISVAPTRGGRTPCRS